MSSRASVLVIDEDVGTRGTLAWDLTQDGLEVPTADTEDRARLFDPRIDADVRQGRAVRLDIELELGRHMLPPDGAEISAGVTAKVGTDLQIARAAGRR